MDQRRAAFALRNYSVDKIDRMHREGQTKREEKKKKDEALELQPRIKESIDKVRHEIAHHKIAGEF